jgi:phosphoglycerol transferase
MTSPETKQRSRPKTFDQLWTIGEYLVVGLTNFLIAIWVYGLWGKNFSTPWTRGGDGDLPIILVRTIQKHGWFFDIPQLGAPHHSNIYDLPQGGENLQWLAMKFLACFTTAPGAVNIYYLFTFSAVGMAAYGAAKWWGLKKQTSFAVAVIYAFLSYHFYRNETHLLLSMYATIPLALTYCYKSSIAKVEMAKWKWILFVIVLSSVNSYYTVFALLLIFCTAVFNLLRNKRESLKQHVILIGSIVLVFIVNLLPSILYWLKHGQNAVVSKRSYADPEEFGLQLTDLFVPRSNHRVGFLAHIGTVAHNAGIVSEQGQSLGFITAFGVAALLIYGFYKLIRSEKMPEQSHFFFVLLIVMMLVTVSSGPTLLGGMAGFTFIRSWNRVDVIIAFIGLLFVGHLFDTYINKKKFSQILVIGFLVLVAIFAVLDQSTPGDKFPNKSIETQQKSECSFIKHVNKRVPKNSNVFDLPFVRYPEVSSVVSLGEYMQGIVTYCDTSLHFSYGAIRGRDDSFQRHIGTKYSCEKISQCKKITKVSRNDIKQLKDNNFHAIFVYRAGYADQGTQIVKVLTEQLGEPISSPDGSQLAFFIK